MTGKIFISYRREDSSWSTGRIYDRLAKHFSDEQLFIDVDSIAPGDDFIAYIEDAVRHCDVLLAIIGQKWLEIINQKLGEVDFVQLEITTALKNGIRVIPILVENTRMPSAKELPEALQQLAGKNAFFVNHVSFGSEMETLIQKINSFFLQKQARAEEERKQQQTFLEQEKAGKPEEPAQAETAEDHKLAEIQLEATGAQPATDEKSGEKYGQDSFEPGDYPEIQSQKSRFPGWIKMGAVVLVITLLLYLVFYTNPGNILNNQKEENTGSDTSSAISFLPEDSPVSVREDPNPRQTKEDNEDDKLFAKVEVEPKFSGDWQRYLERNLNSSVAIDNGAPAGRYPVVVSFIVNKAGVISDVVALTDPGYGTAQEAVRIIKSSPAWIPASQNGRYVSFRQKQPIIFEVKDQKIDSTKK